MKSKRQLNEVERAKVASFREAAFSAEPDPALRWLVAVSSREVRNELRKIGNKALNGTIGPVTTVKALIALFGQEEGTVAATVFSLALLDPRLKVAQYTLHEMVWLYDQTKDRDDLRREARLIENHLRRHASGKDRTEFEAIIAKRAMRMAVENANNDRTSIDPLREVIGLTERMEILYTELKARCEDDLKLLCGGLIEDPATAAGVSATDRLSILRPETQKLDAEFQRLYWELANRGFENRDFLLLSAFIKEWDSRWVELRQSWTDRTASYRIRLELIWIKSWLGITRPLMPRDVELIRELVELGEQIQKLETEKQTYSPHARASVRVWESSEILDEIVLADVGRQRYLAIIGQPADETFVPNQQWLDKMSLLVAAKALRDDQIGRPSDYVAQLEAAATKLENLDTELAGLGLKKE